jgi:hypothetical protein
LTKTRQNITSENLFMLGKTIAHEGLLRKAGKTKPALIARRILNRDRETISHHFISRGCCIIRPPASAESF